MAAMKPRDPFFDYLRRPSRRRLRAVVREHYEFVWQVAYRVLGNVEDAADVSQDVFLRLLARPPSADAVASPKGYLSWCVVGRANTLRRSAERRRERERVSLEKLARGGLETDDVEMLRAALEALPFELRQVVELRYLAEMPTREIADVLSISERAVRLRVEKAREMLKGRLTPLASGLLAAGGALTVEAAPPPPADLLEGLLRIAQMGAPLEAHAAGQSASVGVPSADLVLTPGSWNHWTTGTLLMNTKNLCAGAILSIVILCGFAYLLSPGTNGRVGSDLPARAGTEGLETAARLRAKEPADDASLHLKDTAQPLVDAVEIGALQPISLEGRVTSTSGEPISGARVMALERRTWDDALRGERQEGDGGPLRLLRGISERSRRAAPRVPRVETAADGTYAFRRLTPGDYQVMAGHPDFLPRHDAWAIVEEGTAARADIALDRGQVLAGKVVDDAGEPAPGAAVRARPTAKRVAKGMGKLILSILENTEGNFLLEAAPVRTDAAGGFRLVSLEPVLQDIAAVDEQRGRGEARGVPPLKTDCVIVLSRGVEVAGRVLTPAGDPVAGAEAALEEPESNLSRLSDEDLIGADVDVLGETTRTATTNDDGRFRISAFERGDLEIRIRAPRYLERVDAVRVQRDRVDLGDFVLEEPLSILGVVLAPGGAPVERARVSARRGGAAFAPLSSVDTDVRGRFVVEGLAAGSYTVDARAQGFPAAILDAVKSGGVPLTIHLEKGFTVTGTVVDASDGAPVEGARISDTRGRGAAVVTDGNGRFALVAADASRASLEVRHESYQIWSGDVGRDPVEVRLHETPGIRGTVVGPDSRPVKNARVGLEVHGMPSSIRRVFEHFKPHLHVPTAFSAEDGSFFLRVGTWDDAGLVVASAPGYATARVGPIQPPGPGEEWSPIEVRLSPGSSIEGKVTGSSGGPLAGARVLVRPALELSPQAKVILDIAPVAGGQTAFSGLDGGFKVERVEEGTYEVEVSAPGYARKTIESFVVGKGAARLDVLLDKGGSIEGTVVDHRGDPLGGIEIVALLHTGAIDIDDESPAQEASRVRRYGFAGAMGAAAARSDAAGRFKLDRLPEGPCLVVARAPGFEPGVVGPVAAGERADVTLLRHAQLSGAVADAETRLPVTGFGLKLSPARGSRDDRSLERDEKLTLDHASATFLYTELPPEDYLLLVHAAGYTPARTAVKLQPGEEGSVTVLLDHGVRIAGIVRSSAAGTPIVGAEVLSVPSVEEEYGLRPTARSDDEGRFLLQGLTAGEYELRATHPDFVQGKDERTRRVTVPFDDEKVFELRLDPAGRLEGRVTHLPPQGGETSTECYVVLLTPLGDDRPSEGEGSSGRRAKSRRAVILDATGRYSFSGLMAATYRLELVKQAGGSDGSLALKMTLAGQPPLEPGKLLGEAEVRPGETTTFDADVP